MSAKVQPLLTVADLELMPDDGNRYELFEGELFVSRSPGIPHQVVLGNIYFVLRTYLVQNPLGEVVITPGVMFNDLNAAIPDALFFSHQRGKEVIHNERLYGPPELMIEILSRGKENIRRDREVKLKVYAKYGVKEYWIIDPANLKVEVYRLKRRHFALVETLAGDDELTSPVLPGLKCKVRGFFSS